MAAGVAQEAKVVASPLAYAGYPYAYAPATYAAAPVAATYAAAPVVAPPSPPPRTACTPAAWAA